MLLSHVVWAQGENKMWAFGIHNGLDFNSSPPVFFLTSNMSAEGCASVASAGGSLLFYSNGNNVWNASGAVMPNGSGILGNGAYPGAITGSSAQGVAIVKSMSNSDQYYLFTLDALEQISVSYPGYLRYSLVDMSLNGGTGDIVAGQKNIVLDSFMSEKMTVTKGADCYYWLLTHRRNGPSYRAFKITAAGIQPAVSSDGTWQGSLSGGQLKVSFNGTRIANSTEYGVEIGTFNNATGMVSNTGTLDSLPGNGHFGACFSPDDQKLYIGTSVDIAQYDMSAYPNIASVAASKVVLSPAPVSHAFGQFRNGPDGKIYVGFFANYPYLAIVNAPNNNGAACNFNLTGLLQPATALGPPGFSMGLGNDFVINAAAEPDTTVNSVTDTLLCFADAFPAAASGVSDSYLWNDGNTNASRILTQDGTYWVYGFQSCGMVVVDSFTVRFLNMNVNIGNDTAMCPGDWLILNAAYPGASYHWQDNSNASTLKVTGSGTYSVTVNKQGCLIFDTIVVAMIDPMVIIPERDTTICAGDNVTLHAVSSQESYYNWSNGSTQANISINKAGVYTVTASNVCGIFTDSVSINTKDCQCLAFVPNVFSPNDDGKNDRFKVELGCMTASFKLAIYNRYGQRIYQTNDQSASWDGLYKNKYADAGTYFYYLQYKNGFGTTIEKKGDLTLLR